MANELVVEKASVQNTPELYLPKVQYLLDGRISLSLLYRV